MLFFIHSTRLVSELSLIRSLRYPDDDSRIFGKAGGTSRSSREITLKLSHRLDNQVVGREPWCQNGWLRKPEGKYHNLKGNPLSALVVGLRPSAGTRRHSSPEGSSKASSTVTDASPLAVPSAFCQAAYRMNFFHLKAVLSPSFRPCHFCGLFEHQSCCHRQ